MADIYSLFPFDNYLVGFLAFSFRICFVNFLPRVVLAGPVVLAAFKAAVYPLHPLGPLISAPGIAPTSDISLPATGSGSKLK